MDSAERCVKPGVLFIPNFAPENNQSSELPINIFLNNKNNTSWILLKCVPLNLLLLFLLLLWQLEKKACCRFELIEVQILVPLLLITFWPWEYFWISLLLSLFFSKNLFEPKEYTTESKFSTDWDKCFFLFLF